MNSPFPIDGKRVGVLGGEGLLGGNLVDFFSKIAEVDSITRSNYQSKIGNDYDVLINANGNSRRFWGNEHPVEDFKASTESVFKSLFDFKYIHYIYISSSDVYKDHRGIETTKEENTIEAPYEPYGFHKWLSERIVQNYAPSYLILRMSALLGSGLKKGPVYDILQRKPLFVTEDSNIQFITAEEVFRIIKTLFEKRVSNEVYNVGGVGSVKVSRIAEVLGLSVEILPEAKKQQYEMNTGKLSSIFDLKNSEEYIINYIHGEEKK